MSSDTLCKLAFEIGYRPTDRKLAPDALEWMFLQNDASKAFLHWFCNNISSKNVLTDAEIQECVPMLPSQRSNASFLGCLPVADLNICFSRHRFALLQQQGAVLSVRITAHLFLVLSRL